MESRFMATLYSHCSLKVERCLIFVLLYLNGNPAFHRDFVFCPPRSNGDLAVQTDRDFA